MKILLTLLLAALPILSFSQITLDQKDEIPKLHQLIEQYSRARESRDTLLLKEILTEDVDQLVSNGEWRNGIQTATQGMQQSSSSNPGSRRLEVEKIKFLSDEIALVDCKYIITDPSGIERNLWSSFTVVFRKKSWKISAIRNMNPSGN